MVIDLHYGLYGPMVDTCPNHIFVQAIEIESHSCLKNRALFEFLPRKRQDLWG